MAGQRSFAEMLSAARDKYWLRSEEDALKIPRGTLDGTAATDERAQVVSDAASPASATAPVPRLPLSRDLVGSKATDVIPATQFMRSLRKDGGPSRAHTLLSQHRQNVARAPRQPIVAEMQIVAPAFSVPSLPVTRMDAHPAGSRAAPVPEKRVFSSGPLASVPPLPTAASATAAETGGGGALSLRQRDTASELQQPPLKKRRRGRMASVCIGIIDDDEIWEGPAADRTSPQPPANPEPPLCRKLFESTPNTAGADSSTSERHPTNPLPAPLAHPEPPLTRELFASVSDITGAGSTSGSDLTIPVRSAPVVKPEPPPDGKEVQLAGSTSGSDLTIPRRSAPVVKPEPSPDRKERCCTPEAQARSEPAQLALPMRSAFTSAAVREQRQRERHAGRVRKIKLDMVCAVEQIQNFSGEPMWYPGNQEVECDRCGRLISYEQDGRLVTTLPGRSRFSQSYVMCKCCDADKIYGEIGVWTIVALCANHESSEAAANGKRQAGDVNGTQQAGEGVSQALERVEKLMQTVTGSDMLSATLGTEVELADIRTSILQKARLQAGNFFNASAPVQEVQPPKRAAAKAHAEQAPSASQVAAACADELPEVPAQTSPPRPKSWAEPRTVGVGGRLTARSNLKRHATCRR